MYVQSRSVVSLLVAVALLLAACGGAAETIAEQIVEESAGGDAEVDFDSDSGNLSIETDEGTIEVGTDVEIPDGLTVDVPPGGSVMSAFDFDNDISVSVSYDLDQFDTLVDFYATWTAGQSGNFEVSTGEFESADGFSFKTATWYDSETDTTIGMVSCHSAESAGEEPDSVCLNILQSP